MDKELIDNIIVECCNTAIEYAFKFRRNYFYIGFPFVNDPRVHGMFVSKTNDKGFLKNVRGFYGKSIYISSKNWTKNHIIDVLSRNLDIPIWKFLGK